MEMQEKIKSQVVRSNAHRGLIERQAFLMLPLEHALSAQALTLNCVSSFLPSAYFDGHDKKEQWENLLLYTSLG